MHALVLYLQRKAVLLFSINCEYSRICSDVNVLPVILGTSIERGLEFGPFPIILTA